MISPSMMAYGALAAILAILGFYKYGYHNGWTDRDVEMQIVIAKKNEEARSKEQEMANAIAVKDKQLKKANDEIDKKQDAMRRLAAAGQLRLPAASCVQPAEGSSAASQHATDATELERQTIEALISIAADGDKAINQLNACIDNYNKVMETINADR
jgi:hypothetical protein